MRSELKLKALKKVLVNRYFKQPKWKEIKIKLLSRQIEYFEKYDINVIAENNELIEDIEKKREVDN